MSSVQADLRRLPGVDTLLQQDGIAHLVDKHGRPLVVEAIRRELDQLRQDMLSEARPLPPLPEIRAGIVQHLEALLKPTLEPVINATGVIIHTNLGRALLSKRARQAMQEAAAAYNNLEYDLEAGRRGSRYRHAEELLCRLTGAEAAVVVNNNAAALVLCLTALAQGKEVIINRSQLVEIGGGFRIPDIMAQSGARLVEVGTTNRSYIRDYEARLDPEQTGLLLRVHHSNFKIIGFTTEPSLSEMVTLGNKYKVPVMDDLGSGTLLDTRPFGLAHEPTIQESIAAGVSVVTASSDKLLGGPQAGLILGRKDIIAHLKKHPLIRAFRVDKTTLAALQATLLAYVEGQALREIPVWQMIALPESTLKRRARRWQRQLAGAGLPVSVVTTQSTVGGGSLPGQLLPTHALALNSHSPSQLAAALRAATPPVVARVEDEQLLFDPRTVLSSQESRLLETITETFAAGQKEPTP